MDTHYVCIGGCGLVSEVLAKCSTPGCRRSRNPLVECKCKNGQHTSFYKIYNPEMLKKKVVKKTKKSN